MKHAYSCRLRCSKRAPQTGFTLIELMIVVAIIGILMAVALPSYRAYIERGDRASARAALMEAQQFMERFYATNDRYDQDKAGSAVALPARLLSVPADSPKYTLSLNTTTNPLTVNSYQLEAAPIGTVSKCATLTLTNTGVKGMTGSGTVADCWK